MEDETIMSVPLFKEAPVDKASLEDAGDFTPRFNDQGLITAIVTDATTKELLMVAHMNVEALALTLKTGIAHYFSRSRGKIWMKGETSGNTQSIKEILTDCDQDAIWLKVDVGGDGASCHTGRTSCFYRSVEIKDGRPATRIIDDEMIFDPNNVYGKNH